MASTLPQVDSCCLPCSTDNQVIVNVPGPAGNDGADGTNGIDGANAFTALSAAFTMPAELATATATVDDTSWMVVGQVVFVQTLGYMEVVTINSGISVDLTNLEDSGTSAYTDNAAPGTIAPIASSIAPAGLQGPGTTAAGAAGGDLKGTYPNPTLSIANTLGSIPVGNGTDTTALAAGTNGTILASDNTAGNGVAWKHSLPITGDTNVANRRIPRLTSNIGTPIALEASRAAIANVGAAGVGAFVLDASAGNSRGTDAVDLQVLRAAAGQVASGSNSFIGGGVNNTASNTYGAVAAGVANTCSAIGGFIGSGNSNVVSGTSGACVSGDTNSVAGGFAFCGAGNLNSAVTDGSAVVGGQSNTAGTAANARAFVGGGQANVSTGQESCICGGQANQVTSTQGAVCGGDTNIVSGQESFIGGGKDNTVSGKHASIVGGLKGLADKYGQRAYGAGAFSNQGDAQQTDLIFHISTAGNVATEMFLDGISERATVPNNTSWVFRILLVGRSSAGVDAAWSAEGLIHNNATNTAMTCVATIASICDGTGATWGVVGNFAVTADNANDSLKLAVTGAIATNIRWVAHARIVEVNY